MNHPEEVLKNLRLRHRVLLAGKARRTEAGRQKEVGRALPAG